MPACWYQSQSGGADVGLRWSDVGFPEASGGSLPDRVDCLRKVVVGVDVPFRQLLTVK